MSITRIPWSMLRAANIADHADDITEHYARELAGLADGEARWLRQVACGQLNDKVVRTLMARALLRAAMKLEADHGRRSLALGNAKEAS